MLHRRGLAWLKSLLSISLVIVSGLSIIGHDVKASSLTPHSPIMIDGNAGFTPGNGVTAGSGSASDPYVIEGWDIDTSTTNGIQIFNTDAHFVMRNVLTRPPSFGWRGLILLGVTNGFIENSTFTAVEIGDYSRNIVISRTKFNGGGVSVEISYNITLTNDTFMRSGVSMFSYEITISHSSFIDSNLSNLSFPIVNATIKANEFWNSNIELVYCGCGVRVAENNFTLGRVFFSFPEVCDESCYSVRASDYTDTAVYHNNFLTSLSQASTGLDGFDGRMVWDKGYPDGGNFWSDYSGVDKCSGPDQDVCTGPDGLIDTPLAIGGSLSRDRYPLTQPFVTLVGTLDIGPNPILLKAGGYLTGNVELPQGFSVSNIDPQSVRLNNTIPIAYHTPVRIGDHDKNGIPELIVKFSLQDVKGLFSKPGVYTLQITGNTVVGGRHFMGFDTIRVF